MMTRLTRQIAAIVGWWVGRDVAAFVIGGLIAIVLTAIVQMSAPGMTTNDMAACVVFPLGTLYLSTRVLAVVFGSLPKSCDEPKKIAHGFADALSYAGGICVLIAISAGTAIVPFIAFGPDPAPAWSAAVLAVAVGAVVVCGLLSVAVEHVDHARVTTAMFLVERRVAELIAYIRPRNARPPMLKPSL